MQGIVVFAHGSGSGRFSPRNQFVARVLEHSGLATLLIDLLEEDEAADREKVFDIPLLAERLQSAANWVLRQPELNVLEARLFWRQYGSWCSPGSRIAPAKHRKCDRICAAVGQIWPRTICPPCVRRRY